MRFWLAAALLAGLTHATAAQPPYGGAAGAYAVYGTPPAIAAGRCERGTGNAPSVAGVFGEPADRACLGLVLEYAHDRQWVNWPTARGDLLAVSPMRTYEATNGYCRDFMSVAAQGAIPTLRTACRDAVGRWNLDGATSPRPAMPNG